MIVGNRSCGGAEHSGRVLVQPVLPQCSMAGPGRKLSHRTWQRHAAVPKRPNIQSHAFREWFTSFVQPTNPTNSAPAAKITPKRDFLEARQVALYQLFDNQEYKFDVPAYQRPYSWGTKQVYEMLQDFIAAYRNKQEYFLGAIVTTRTEDGHNIPLQVIDGQQRLTSLFIMLAFVHSWARRQKLEGLETRIRRMLYIDADPLDPSSHGRFRIQLRDGDNQFFTKNVLANFLPTRYELTGVAASSCDAAYPDGTARSQAQAQPLENESWWRMYQNAEFLQKTLEAEIGSGLQLQDFLFHILHSCYVVVMNARDEQSSFRIFSSLNGRGMDLSPVDKLKADLLEALPAAQRSSYAVRWSEMEDVLGRATFHRVFDHMKSLAAVLEPQVEQMTVLEYFGARRSGPKAVASIIDVALDYGKILLQLRQCRWEVTPTGPNHRLLQEDPRTGSIVAVYDAGGPGSSATTHGAIRPLERQSRHMNFFSDELWVPSVLEFFMQVDDCELRTQFLQRCEVLQLYTELAGDLCVRKARWRRVEAALLARDPHSEDLPTDVFSAVGLTVEERAMFKKRLDQRDVRANVPHRTLAHLLLRAEGAAVSANPAIQFSQLSIQRVLPLHPPEGSLWRRNKVGGGERERSPEGGSASADSGRAQAGSGGRGGRAGSAPASSRASPGSNGRASPRRSPAATDIKLLGREVPGFKYWHEVQRNKWHSRLGNLVLLPVSSARGAEVEESDFDAKAAFFTACGVEAVFPEWSGSVASGVYARNKFSAEECMARHVALVARIAEVFHLDDVDWDEELWEDDEDDEWETDEDEE